MDKSRDFATLSAGLLARKGEAVPAMETFDAASIFKKITKKPVPETKSGSQNSSTPPELDEKAAEQIKAFGRLVQGMSKGMRKKARGSQSSDTSPTEVNVVPAIIQQCSEQGACGADKQSVDSLEHHTTRARAKVTVRMTTPEFLRMKLAMAQVELTGQDLIMTALERYLDDLNVESVKNCKCMRRIADLQDKLTEK